MKNKSTYSARGVRLRRCNQALSKGSLIWMAARNSHFLQTTARRLAASFLKITLELDKRPL